MNKRGTHKKRVYCIPEKKGGGIHLNDIYTHFFKRICGEHLTNINNLILFFNIQMRLFLSFDIRINIHCLISK